jgi:hypothetical protein
MTPMNEFSADVAMMPVPGEAAMLRAGPRTRTTPRIMLVAPGGGRWVELLCLRDARLGKDASCVALQASYQSRVVGPRVHRVRDATRRSRWSLVRMVAQVAWVVLRERPDVVITSGSPQGVVALRVGKWLGARTVGLDSIVSSDSLRW